MNENDPRYRGKKEITQRIGASWESIQRMKADGLLVGKIYGRWILYESDLKCFERTAISTCQKSCQ